jgi:predicted nucleic acid-binding protein
VGTAIRRIVDSSALILLAKIGQLDLLRVGVPEIVVPDTVLAEVGALGPSDLVFQQIQNATWLKIVHTPLTPPPLLAWCLGAGESSVPPIAMSDPDCEAVLDDRDAHRGAQAMKIGIRGTIGLVILAKQIGERSTVRPVVQQLRQSGLFITDDVANAALALVGE